MKSVIFALCATVLISGGVVFGGRIALDNLASQVKQNQVQKVAKQNAQLQILLAQL